MQKHAVLSAARRRLINNRIQQNSLENIQQPDPKYTAFKNELATLNMAIAHCIDLYMKCQP
jgi:hypothetical protein